MPLKASYLDRDGSDRDGSDRDGSDRADSNRNNAANDPARVSPSSTVGRSAENGGLVITASLQPDNIVMLVEDRPSQLASSKLPRTLDKRLRDPFRRRGYRQVSRSPAVAADATVDTSPLCFPTAKRHLESAMGKF